MCNWSFFFPLPHASQSVAGSERDEYSERWDESDDRDVIEALDDGHTDEREVAHWLLVAPTSFISCLTWRRALSSSFLTLANSLSCSLSTPCDERELLADDLELLREGIGAM